MQDKPWSAKPPAPPFHLDVDVSAVHEAGLSSGIDGDL